jgi:Spy/CpxP family protein refolding chaperone
MLGKTKILGVMLVTAVVMNLPMWVYADNSGGDRDWHQDGRLHHGDGEQMVAKVLNLSEDQVKQLKDLHQKQRESMKSVFAQMKSNREAFNAQIIKATPDMNKVNDLQAQLKTIQSQMIDNHLNSMLEIKKILTPEQFAGYMALKKARQLMMQHGDKHKHWGNKADRDHDLVSPGDLNMKKNWDLLVLVTVICILFFYGR